jgi:hypothetical protein
MAKKSSINIEKHIMALHKTNSIRGFDHIDSGYVTLRDYLFYNDILYHGSLIEKIT